MDAKTFKILKNVQIDTIMYTALQINKFYVIGCDKHLIRIQRDNYEKAVLKMYDYWGIYSVIKFKKDVLMCGGRNG